MVLLVRAEHAHAYAHAESELNISVYNSLQILIDSSIKVMRVRLQRLLRVPEFADPSSLSSLGDSI